MIARMGKVAAYGLVPILSIVSLLITIPAVVRVGGSSGWAAIAIGQAVGSSGALLVSYGWGLIGPTLVAQARRGDRAQIYWTSFAIRGVLATVLAPTCATASALLVQTPEYRLASALTAAAFAIQGLSPGWYLIGMSRPLVLLTVEAVPRVVGTASVALIAIQTESLVAFGAGLLIIELAISTMGAILFARRALPMKEALGLVRTEFLAQRHLMTGIILSASYTRLSVPIVSAVDYRAVAVFAACDRIISIARSGLRPFLNFFQAWVAELNSSPRRPRKATATTMCVALVGATGLGATLPGPLGQLVFRGEVTVPVTQAVLSAICVLLLAAGYSTSLYYLLPRQQTSIIARSSILGAGVGVPSVCIGALLGGSAGALGGVIIAEACVVTRQVIGIRSIPTTLEQPC